MSTLPQTLPFTVNGWTFNMNRVEGNRDAQTPFMMGGDAEADEKPIHPVRLSTFYMGEFLVTQGLWKAVMGENPAYFQHSDQHPVEHISWLDITETFLPQLNTLLAEPRKTYGGGAFQLPTEAQWEYAARGGRDAVPNLAYAGSEYLHEVGWFDENSHNQTHAVGEKFANPLGLYDMSGNVWEWCADWYSEQYYEDCLKKTKGGLKTKPDAVTDPVGPGSGAFRVLRGGGYFDHAIHWRASFRDRVLPGNRHDHVGFRLVFPVASTLAS